MDLLLLLPKSQTLSLSLSSYAIILFSSNIGKKRNILQFIDDNLCLVIELTVHWNCIDDAVLRYIISFHVERELCATVASFGLTNFRFIIGLLKKKNIYRKGKGLRKIPINILLCSEIEEKYLLQGVQRQRNCLEIRSVQQRAAATIPVFNTHFEQYIIIIIATMVWYLIYKNNDNNFKPAKYGFGLPHDSMSSMYIRVSYVFFFSHSHLYFFAHPSFVCISFIPSSPEWKGPLMNFCPVSVFCCCWMLNVYRIADMRLRPNERNSANSYLGQK